jgi:hypothetical protein
LGIGRAGEEVGRLDRPRVFATKEVHNDRRDETGTEVGPLFLRAMAPPQRL